MIAGEGAISDGERATGSIVDSTATVRARCATADVVDEGAASDVQRAAVVLNRAARVAAAGVAILECQVGQREGEGAVDGEEAGRVVAADDDRVPRAVDRQVLSDRDLARE